MISQFFLGVTCNRKGILKLKNPLKSIMIFIIIIFQQDSFHDNMADVILNGDDLHSYR